MNRELIGSNTLKDLLGHFGRAMALLLNRGMMYQKDHPVIQESIGNVHKILENVFSNLSSLVFILNRGQFFVDEEPLDPRINVARAADLFKSVGIQSISFERGATPHELTVFVEHFSKLNKASDVEELKKSLSRKGVFHIKVNHVTYQRVTEDDQVVSRDALKQVTPLMDVDDQQGRKKFLDALLESVLSEELSKTLSINSLMTNPGALSQNMIQADLDASRQMAELTPPGQQGAETEGAESEAAPGKGLGNGPGDGPGRGSGAGPGLGPGFGPGVGPSAGAGYGTGVPAGNDAPVADGVGSGVAGLTASGTGGAPGQGSGGAETSTFEGDTLVLESGKGFYAETPATQDQGQPASEQNGPASGAGAAAVPIEPPEAPPPSDAMAPQGTQAYGQEGGEGAAQGGPGALLVHQLNIMQQEVERHLQGGDEVDLSELAFAVFDMKKQLLESIQTQKALGVAYANEAAIVENANKLSDKIVVRLVREEYAAGEISIQRLAMIVKRLIPDAADLKRLMPKIKVALLASGMSMEDYMALVTELKNELQNEELSRILQDSAESIGIDGDELIAEFRRNPGQAAELIYLASEIRAGSGDEAALTSILVDYVEKLGGELAQDPEGDKDHLGAVITEIESGLLRQLGKMNIDVDVLSRMEARINERMEAILDKMRVEWLRTHSRADAKPEYTPMTVLQTLENNVGDDSEMKQILEAVRQRVDEGDIEENDFSQIYDEIGIQKQRVKKKGEGKGLTADVLQSDELIYLLEKEIAKAKRYNTTFSVLAFSFVTAKPKVKTAKNALTHEAILETALEELSDAFREADFIGQIGRNKLLVILPMTGKTGAEMALARVLRELHAEPILVRNVPVQLRVAGIAEAYDSDQGSDARLFAKGLSNQLMDMVTRVKNIQVLV